MDVMEDRKLQTIIRQLTNSDISKLIFFTFRENECDEIDNDDVEDLHLGHKGTDQNFKWIETLTYGNDIRAWEELLYSIQRYDLLNLIGSSPQRACEELKTRTHFPLVCRLLLDLYNSTDRASEETLRLDVENLIRSTIEPASWINRRSRPINGDLSGYNLSSLLLLFANKHGILKLRQIFHSRNDDWYRECAKKINLYLHGQRYPIDRLPAGLCVIVNNKDFDDPKLERVGSERDLELLQKLFTDLGFIERSMINCSREMLTDNMRKIANEDHTNYSAFICILMSHGQNDSLLCSDGQLIDLKSDILREFSGENCPTLKGKPKLFFVQACRVNGFHVFGDSCISKSVHMDHDLTNLSNTKNILNGTHDEADVLVSYATVEGWPALRCKNGTPYVNALVQTLREWSSSEDIVKILTKINNKVGNAIQQPSFTSTFCKEFRFNVLHN